MANFYTIVTTKLHLCSDIHSLNSEIQFLKAIAIDIGYNPSIIDTTLFKLLHPQSSNLLEFN